MKKRRLLETWRIVFKGVRIPWMWFLFCLICSFMVANTMIKTAALTATIIDKSGNIKTQMLIDFVIYTLASTLLTSFSGYSGSVMSQKLNIGVRNRLWNKMLRLPMRQYDMESGETLVSRITADCDMASSYFGSLIQLLSSVYAIGIAVQSMWGYSPLLTCWLIVLLPIFTLLASLCGKLVMKMYHQMYLHRSNMTTYLLERVRNFRLVRASNMADEELAEGASLFRRMFTASLKTMGADSLMSSFISLTSIGVIVVTFIIGSQQIAAGSMTTGMVVGFFSIASMAGIRFNVLITMYGNVVTNNGVFAKIADVLEAEEENTEGRPVDVPDADIRFEHVNFAYKDRPVLDDFSCVIPKKQVTAIVGANGAGKSTLFKLLCRMYEPSDGTMYFGDTPAKTFSLQSWRKAFAVVAQDRPLLSGTIRENITYGCDRAITETELELVAQQAGILDLVKSLPDGFDTDVGPGGSNFSGGQRQCIAIARAIMRNPDYLLLDEATSNLDAQSEQMVSAALAHLMQGRTTIMIGHSLSAIRGANNLIVLKDGKLEAEGAPDDVYLRSETYRTFVDSQKKAA